MTKKDIELGKALAIASQDAIEIIDVSRQNETNPQVKRRYIVNIRPNKDLTRYFIEQFQQDVEEGHLFDIIWSLSKIEKARENNFISSVADDFGSNRYTLSPSCPDENCYITYMEIAKQLELYGPL